ncbi:PREDICTED: kinesin-like protein KIN-12E [Nicotiana attenuata]|uniref:Phragmoplast orienting kinesin 2 n=1 Tax=Nicotiana attenuata TaxID=49451 RepID=A0A314KXP3_NICAT|nr:PREDICTED: kinesin-like protein KIN-12E [Nicotiana attenuata]OIT33992.1 phragmoplast orienting kinesin 2 [Nicotiana attenuata]
MPLFSEDSSAIRSRFRSQQDHSSTATPMDTPASVTLSSVKSTPNLRLFKSAAKDRIDTSHSKDMLESQNRSFEFHEDPSFWKEHNVQVIIRIRPLSNSEISLQGHSKCVRQESSQTITWTGHPESRFTFDMVADENVTQEMLFKAAGVPMVENCVGGYNSCMFAYGQTGSGKTHTMLGDIEGGTRRHSADCGMTPRVFEYMFSRIQKEREARREENIRFTCRCSFLEIYNEQILDLLDPSSVNLQIREDTKKGIHVEDLREVEVTSARDVMQQLLQGAANRKVAATNMNRASSRSHSVFTCVIESKWESQGVTHHRFARLNLVDLAGSERQKSSGAEGERLKEATNINKSLSTLGLVIMNLVSISNGKSQHVPYRDSKLTFLLQDSLGGNAKTCIIANISPSSCCSLETLSTLKFAQRAKFIKNHAVVNEDASGDVLAMRIQIQNLKKEVARLRSMVDGGAENHENDAWTVAFPGSPATVRWEGLHGLSSPLTSDKRMSKKKDYEVALIGAFRREKDKDIALQALTAENQAAMQLIKQREAEIQGLKMRLRFREASIKRLESVASGKISAEMHLLKEKEEHLKEIEVLRNQVDRNQEVTRFAMENLQLKEEIGRLKSFYEEGERERMNEQIAMLQDKLLEALDWKLMHESYPATVQKGSSELGLHIENDLNLLTSCQPASPWRTSINEENEFLRVQAIQNQAELDALHRKLDFCVEEREKLERQLNDLEKELEFERSSKAVLVEESKKGQNELPSAANDQMPAIAVGDQAELKTIVDAIAAASQREAEAHETAISLSKENDELRVKLKVLIEDNNKLIELYEQAVAEKNNENDRGQNCQQKSVPSGDEHALENHSLDDNVRSGDLETLEEAGLHEVDVHDEYSQCSLLPEKNNISDSEELSCCKTTEMIEKKPSEPNEENTFETLDKADYMMVETVFPESTAEASTYEPPEDPCASNLKQDVEMEDQSSNVLRKHVPEELSLVRKKLEEAQEKLLKSANTISMFGSLERAIVEVDELTGEIERLEESIEVKKQGYTSFKLQSSQIHEKKVLLDKKLSALRCSLSSFSSSVCFFEQREAQARARLDASNTSLNQKRAKLAHLQASKAEFLDAQVQTKQSESELRNILADLKSRLEEENRRLESDRVLFPIDNIEKPDIQLPERNWQLSGKATELLKSEEEKTKIQNQIKQIRENLGMKKKETEELNVKMLKSESEIEAIEKEIQNGLQLVEEMGNKLQSVIREKEMILEMKEDGKHEFESMILEYHESMFEASLKEEELQILDEELHLEMKKIEDLQRAKALATTRKSQLLNAFSCQSCSFSDKVEEDLHDIRRSVLELNPLLGIVDN